MALTPPPTAVVISYNSASDLQGCLAGPGRAGVPALVVDNGSRGGSVQLARGLGYRQHEVLELESNPGFTGSCTRGLAAVPTEVFCFAFINPETQRASA